jgi:ribose/xylose/arabinose/galactoside ABC-type transport system permease subunit
MLAARVYSGDPVIGLPMGMDSVAATLVGGTAISGGIGGPVGSLAGAILLSMMSNLLNLLDVYVYYQYILRGLILCGALVLYQIRRQGGKAK